MDMIPTAALTVVLGHLILGIVLWLGVRKLYSLPGHFGFPVIGNLYYFYRTLLLTTVESTRKYMTSITEEYGKNGLCFHWIFGFRKVVLVTSPHIVKELAFHPNLSDKPISYQPFNIYMDGPFGRTHADDIWKLRRKEYSNSLKKSRVDSAYYNTFIKCANKMVELLLASHSAVDVHHETMGVTQNASMETLFGIETSIVYDPNLNSVISKFDTIASILIASPTITKTLLHVVRAVDEILICRKARELRKEIITEMDQQMKSSRSSQQEKEELNLAMMIASRTKKENRTERQLLDELQEVFFVSSHTVTAVIVNSLIFLAVLPDLQERAWKEQNEIFGNDDREPTADDLKQMLFLDRFLQESLRFSYPASMGKLATGDITVDGVTIPKGTMVLYLMDYLRMDPKYFKNPKGFDPDRFLEENDTLKYSFTPFAFGIRNCPGMYFALVEVKIIISKVLRRLKITPVNKGIRFQDLKFRACIMVEVENPPRIQVEERT